VSITVSADVLTGKSAPVVAAPSERIAAANRAFIYSAAPSGLSHLNRQYLRGDQASTALSYLLGTLEVLTKYPNRLTPEELAYAVETAVEFGLNDTAAVPGIRSGASS
jgi:hypothetical protein